MNCESCDEPKNSRTAAAAGFALIRSCGMTVSISTDDMRSLIARSMRRRPMRYWFSISSPTDLTLAIAQVEQRADHRHDVFLAQHAHRVGRVELKAHVHLHAADRREVVAL